MRSIRYRQAAGQVVVSRAGTARRRARNGGLHSAARRAQRYQRVPLEKLRHAVRQCIARIGHDGIAGVLHSANGVRGRYNAAYTVVAWYAHRVNVEEPPRSVLRV